MQPSDIGTVLMVGGSSRIPAFQQMLERIFGRPPVFSRNLDEDVARGAAMLGAKEGTGPGPADRARPDAQASRRLLARARRLRAQR